VLFGCRKLMFFGVVLKLGAHCGGVVGIGAGAAFWNGALKGIFTTEAQRAQRTASEKLGDDPISDGNLG
jgi:hypothetical protein